MACGRGYGWMCVGQCGVLPFETWHGLLTGYHICLSHLKSAGHIEPEVSPWFTRQEAISAFHEKWSTQFAFTPYDKNTGKAMTLCQCLYAKCNLELYEDQKQFEVVAGLKDHAKAKKTRLNMLMKAPRPQGSSAGGRLEKGRDRPLCSACQKTRCSRKMVSSRPAYCFPTNATPFALDVGTSGCRREGTPRSNPCSSGSLASRKCSRPWTKTALLVH